MKTFFHKIKYVLLVATVCSLFTNFGLVNAAQSVSSLQSQQQYWADQAAKAKKAQQEKQQQAAALNTQITAVNGEISQTETAIGNTESQISTTNLSIQDLETRIALEEDNLAQETDKMQQVLSSWYMEGDSGLLEAVVGAGTISEVITNQQYFDSVRQQVEYSIENIRKLKDQLNAQKDDKNQQLTDLSDLKATQSDQKSYLEGKKTLKNRLLTDTKGAIADLGTQAAQAEAKAAEIRKIIAQIYASSTGTPKGSQMVSSVDSSWYYNQRDYSTYLSPSRLTIAEVGCLITSYAMVATYWGHPYTPPGIVSISTFDYSGSWRWFNQGIGVSIAGMQGVNWDVINRELEQPKPHPVIVSVKLPGPIYNSDGSNHFIVIRGIKDGKYLIHDPYWRDSSYDLSSVRSMKLVTP